MVKNDIVNQYAVISDYIDENAPSLTMLQYQKLEALAKQVWDVLERRKARIYQ